MNEALMDYSRKRDPRRGGVARVAASISAVVLLPVLAGCPPEQNQGSGGGQVESAEDLYRRGRGIEDRVAGSESEARANLQQARQTYIAALNARPSPRLESYIRTGI